MIVYCSEIHCRFRNPETNICQHSADKIILRSESVIVGTSLICESALDEYKSPNRFEQRSKKVNKKICDRMPQHGQ